MNLAAEPQVSAAALACVDTTLQEPTSHVSCEVEAQPEASQSAFERLKPEDQIDEVVIMYAVLVAKSFVEIWRQGCKWLVELKARFGVRQGTRGKQLKVEGNLIYWDQFCEIYLHTTAENFKNIVAREKNPPAKKPDEEKPLYKKGYLAGQEKLKTELLGKGVDLKAVVPVPKSPEKPERPDGVPTSEGTLSLLELDGFTDWTEYCEAASELLTCHARSIGLYKKFEVTAPASEDCMVKVDIVL